MNDAATHASRHPALRRIAASQRAVRAIAATAFRHTERAHRPTTPERTA